MATYKIKSGDTLSKIAKRLGTTVSAIMAANKDSIKDKNKIRAGATLKLPAGMGLMEKDGGKSRLEKSRKKSALNIIKKDTNIGTTKTVKKYNLKGGGKGTAAERLAEIDKEKKAEARAKMKPKSKKALDMVFKMLKSKSKKPINTNKGGAVMPMHGKKKSKMMRKGGAMKKTKYMAKGGMKKTKMMSRGGAARRK